MVDISIVIPAYNEENRLPKTLKRTVDYFRAQKESFEVIIVNDGSKDGTEKLVNDFIQQNKEVRMLSHFPNRGRGASVREGILNAEGAFVLETDSDNSTDYEAVGRFLEAFRQSPNVSVIFGSREMKNSVNVVVQPFLRVFLGKGFIYLAKVLFWMWDIHDFTLGFKMFRREAAEDIFKHQYSNHYVAEAEIIFVTRARKWTYKEISVKWTDDPDSRVHPFRDSIRSFKGMMWVLKNYFIGKYSGR